MQQELIFIGVRQVFSVHIKVRGVQVWTNTTILECVANSRPRFWLDWRHKGVRASGGRAVGYALENIYAFAPESPNSPGSCFGDCLGVGSDDPTAFATGV